MNHRVLELLKTPKNIQSEDLNLLKEEIDSFPYIQNIRALYLYGVHRYDKENYQKVLSTTAAYTTDKKILYQLINGKIQQNPKPEISPETVKEQKLPEEKASKPLQQAKVSGFPLKRESSSVLESATEITDAEEIIQDKQQVRLLPEPKPEIKHIYIKGERNRILFEGEENFLEDEEAETIDLESTLESGSIVTQKVKKTEVPEDNERKDAVKNNQEPYDPVNEKSEEFTSETHIEEEIITSEPEKREVFDESELSFQETEAFVPETSAQSVTTDDNQKADDMDNQVEDTDVVHQNAFTSEKIIDENLMSSEKELVQDDSELSFHGMESFLPEVKIQSNTEENVTAEISQPSTNKHEDEMRRLIEEVEKKMKEKAASEALKKEMEAEPEESHHEISFADTQSFEMQSSEPKLKEEDKEDHIQAKETEAEIIDEPKEEIAGDNREQAEIKSEWKPMAFESNLPDSLLSKKIDTPHPKVEIPAKEIQEQNESVPEETLVQDKAQQSGEREEENVMLQEDEQMEDDGASETLHESKEEEAPVMNVSFFGTGWTLAQPEKSKEQNHETQNEKTEEASVAAVKTDLTDSNIPGFINTWQSWLKIDRTAEIEKEKTEIKAKVIEAFIENNPKISQLKDEVNFVVKEKGDDISHLMTETLANLYFEQKLYTKAIKAFEILIGKMPEKEAYFKGKIQEIKDFRTKG
ncbi:hypothetical protein MKJ01_15720 [Chryseobacterium sp. SSA4.19]|uniref:hypothetical protein n=1 Tax=Chryseobacterium sp. SSA4.19 TaxID=2919915 RepID=UPI001F4EC8A9|nr:hypothetical protein [Chryseobacterium sp. SSA4.19]MCJ8155214.1 hypothetical protein [Chryseobacterium sp. SSA4.19]